MSGETSRLAARRYLLGTSTPQQGDEIELVYFADDSALDEVGAEEEALIEDYLAGVLPREDQEQFERHYLRSPIHRDRVETIRRLSAVRRLPRTEPASGHAPRRPTLGWLAIAATLVLAGGTAWLIRGAAPPASSPVAQQPAPAVTQPPVPQRQPVVLAVTLSPINKRSGEDRPPVVVTSGTDIIAVTLQSDIVRGGTRDGQVSITTVNGIDVWSGSARASTAAAGTAFTVDVPTAAIPPNDYILVLSDADASGARQELGRYFLPLRSR
jgi:hypothetical protein